MFLSPEGEVTCFNGFLDEDGEFAGNGAAKYSDGVEEVGRFRHLRLVHGERRAAGGATVETVRDGVVVATTINGVLVGTTRALGSHKHPLRPIDPAQRYPELGGQWRCQFCDRVKKGGPMWHCDVHDCAHNECAPPRSYALLGEASACLHHNR